MKVVKPTFVPFPVFTIADYVFFFAFLQGVFVAVLLLVDLGTGSREELTLLSEEDAADKFCCLCPLLWCLVHTGIDNVVVFGRHHMLRIFLRMNL